LATSWPKNLKSFWPAASGESQDNLTMKTRFKNLFLLPALIAGLSLVPAGRVTAQTFTTLHSFSSYPDDGDAPSGGVILSGNTLYGTTDDGGYASSSGTVYKVNTVVSENQNLLI
jgi:uncharacterized repeat protein (TIGR03803 family)